MEDDEPVAEMPTLICSFEDGRSKVCRDRLPEETSSGESKVERPLWDCSRVTGSTSSLSPDGDNGDTEERKSGEEEQEEGKDNGEVVEKDAKGNNNNNCNGGERRRKKSGQTGDAVIEIQHPEGDSETRDDEGGGQCVNLTEQGHEAAPITKEHVYCTVYCIASERGGAGVAGDGADDTGSRTVPDAPPEVGSSPEPSLYTVDDLVDPFGDIVRRVSFGQADAAVQTCWVCLEGKSIAPLPCCKKTVCDECLKIYVTTQVGNGRGRS